MRRSPALLHTALVLCLTLVMVLTSAHWARGRAEAQGAQALVICADGATVTITLGADGKPVASHHDCPDCVLGGLALAGSVAAPVLAARGRAHALRPLPGRQVLRRQVVARRARGPPAAPAL